MSVDISVTVDRDLAESLKSDLRQILEELGLAQTLRLDGERLP